MTREKLVACATDAAAPSSGTGGAGGAAFCDAPTQVFKNQNYSCTAAGPCHGAVNTSGLDLVTDPEEALFGRPSATALTKCPGEPLVATTAPASGVLFKRLEGDECGPMMPFGSISSDDLQCVKDWVTSELTKMSDEGE